MNPSDDIHLHEDAVRCAARHALGWLVFGNTIGLLLSILLVRPQWQPWKWGYGHWVPLHLNAQLYGWTALPLVGWLMAMYEAGTSKARAWAPAAIRAWTAALAISCFRWSGGETSGKIFLDWRNTSLWSFIIALVLLWLVIAAAWKDRSDSWGKLRRLSSLMGLAVLALVPVMMIVAASPKTYPPVDRTTGGPTGSSLLGSTLLVIGLMLLLPRVTAVNGKGRAGRGTWIFFGFSWLAFAITEAMGGGHFDSWQLGAMLLLVPWAWLIPRDWSGFLWPSRSAPWRASMLLWWAALVLTGVAMYSPGILDRIKFTQGLVAHSHLAMAGFTTAFCALLIGLCANRMVGGPVSVALWNMAVVTMIIVLAVMGWREGSGADWMTVHEGWRETGLLIRTACGTVMLGISVFWLADFRKP